MSKGSKAPSGKKQVDQNGSFIRKGSSGQDSFSQGWNEGFSRKPDKDPSEDFSYTGLTSTPDQIPGTEKSTPPSSGLKVEPSYSNLTRNATDYPADISRNTEASHAEDSRNAASPPVNGLRNTDSPVTDSRYQSESNQIESDAQRAWEEKQAGRTDNRDSAPDAFSDPANEFNPFRDSGRQEEEGPYTGNIRSTTDASRASSTTDAGSKVVASAGSGGSIGGRSAAASATGATIIFNAPPGGNNIGHMAIGTVTRGEKRVFTSALPTSQMKQTHTGYGTSVAYNTVGRYILIPGVKTAYNRVSGVSTTIVSRVMLHNIRKDGFFESLYAHSDFRNATAKALRQRMGRNYVTVEQFKNTGSRLTAKGYGTDIKDLRKMLKSGSIAEKDKALVQSYIRMSGNMRKLDKIVNPTNAKGINNYYGVVKQSLRERGIEPNARKLKKSLKKGKLSGEDRLLAQAYLGINNIHKLSEYNRVSMKGAARSLKRGGARLVRDFRRKLKQMMRQTENSTIEGMMFTYTMARRSLKVARTAIKPVKAAGKVVGRSLRQAHQMTKAGTMMARASGKVVTPVIKQTYKHQMKSAIRGGTRLTRKVIGSVDRAGAKIVAKGSARAAKMSSKAAANLVKVSSKVVAKVMVVVTKAAMYVVNFLISIVSTLLSIGFPLLIILVVAAVIIGIILAIFSFNGGEMEESDDSDTVMLVGQQYVDALDTCHNQFKNYLEKLSSDSSYETVTINYRDEKNETVYKDWENEVGMVNGDNNIKECLCLMSVLFDFNLEEYVPSPLTDEIRYADREKLYEFMDLYDIDKSEYDGTYQNLIRSYLVGIFNGSHDVEKNVTVTYCGGCTSRKNADGEDEYYCPGHRHLDVTVTTYYFDKLFSCALKQTCALDPLSSTLVGSNNIEKVWFGLINAGYSEEAAAGAIGNLMWESGGGPNDIALNAVEDNGEGVGMCQWSYDRKTAFLQFCNQQGVGWPNNDITVQFNFMLQELQGGDWMYVGHDYGYSKNTRKSLEEFKKMTDVEYATYVFCANFERCAKEPLAHMAERVQYAQNVYASYHGRSQSAGGGTGETLQPGQKTVSLGNFMLTYYCGCYECNEGYNDAQGRPVGSLGNPLQKNHSIAVDPSVIPYGSKVLINGIVYTAEDCGGAIKGNHIDIYMGNDANSHAECDRLGVNYAEVFLVK